MNHDVYLNDFRQEIFDIFRSDITRHTKSMKYTIHTILEDS